MAGFLAFFLFLFSAAPGWCGDEARFHALTKEFRCVVCGGQSLAESDAQLARNMRGLIQEQIDSGASDEQIKQYLTSRYGDSILMEPPAEGSNLLIWLAPLLLLAGGGVAVWRGAFK